MASSNKAETNQPKVYQREADVPYNKIRALGSGAFGTVDEIERKSDPTQVYARKLLTLRRRPVDRTAVDETIMHEANVLKFLKHDHIVSLVETYSCGIEFAIIMSPVADGNLGDWLESADYGDPDSKSSTLTNIPQWFGCLASGLEYLHSKDIRHQDIKPENILIHGKNILFTDFGIARLSHELTISVRTNPRGTRKFWAPELDEKKRPGRRADIFSLGAIFLEMLIVYSETTVSETRRLQTFVNSREGPYSKNLDKVEECIKDLDNKASEAYWFRTILFLCRKMLRKEWNKRPFADALRTCWEYAPLTKTPPTSCNCIPLLTQPIPSEYQDTHDQASEDRHQLAVKLINERKESAELLGMALQAMNINLDGDDGNAGGGKSKNGGRPRIIRTDSAISGTPDGTSPEQDRKARIANVESDTSRLQVRTPTKPRSKSRTPSDRSREYTPSSEPRISRFGRPIIDTPKLKQLQSSPGSA